MRTLSLFPIATLLLAACATDDDQPSPTASTQQGLTQVGTSFTFISEGTPNHPDPPDGTLGPMADRNCFLTGIEGGIQGTEVSSQNFVESGGGVYIDRATNTWKVHVSRGYSPMLKITGICVPGTPHRQLIGAIGGTAPGAFDTGTTPNTHCFLTEVYGYGYGFQSFSDSMAVRRNKLINNDFEMYPWSDLTQDDHWQVEGDAICFEPTATQYSSATVSRDPGLPAVAGTAATGAGWQCGLTGIGGKLEFNFAEVVPSDPSSSNPASWQFRVAPGTSISFECMK